MFGILLVTEYRDIPVINWGKLEAKDVNRRKP
jgi:hypothetical protein